LSKNLAFEDPSSEKLHDVTDIIVHMYIDYKKKSTKKLFLAALCPFLIWFKTFYLGSNAALEKLILNVIYCRTPSTLVSSLMEMPNHLLR
jgi:hypothetical protein